MIKLHFNGDRHSLEIEYNRTYPLKDSNQIKNEEFMKRAEICNYLAEKLKNTGFKGALLLRGSVATGIVTPNSDIDLQLTSDFWTYENESRERFDALDNFLESIGDRKLDYAMQAAIVRYNIYKTTLKIEGIKVGIFIFDEGILKDALYIRFKGNPGRFSIPVRDRKKEIEDWIKSGVRGRGMTLSVDVYKREIKTKYGEDVDCPAVFGGLKMDGMKQEEYERCDYVKIRNSGTVDYNEFCEAVERWKGEGNIHAHEKYSQFIPNFLKSKYDRDKVGNGLAVPYISVPVRHKTYVIRNFPSIYLTESLVFGKKLYGWEAISIGAKRIRDYSSCSTFKGLLPKFLCNNLPFIMRNEPVYTRIDEIRDDYIHKSVTESINYFIAELRSVSTPPLRGEFWGESSYQTGQAKNTNEAKVMPTFDEWYSKMDERTKQMLLKACKKMDRDTTRKMMIELYLICNQNEDETDLDRSEMVPEIFACFRKYKIDVELAFLGLISSLFHPGNVSEVRAAELKEEIRHMMHEYFK